MATSRQDLSDIEFVRLCYDRLLKRPVDDEAESNFKLGLENGDLSREQLLILLMTSEEYRLRTEALEFVPPGHFYSAVPSLADREAIISEGRAPVESLPGIALNGASQFSLLKELRRTTQNVRSQVKKQVVIDIILIIQPILILMHSLCTA